MGWVAPLMTLVPSAGAGVAWYYAAKQRDLVSVADLDDARDASTPLDVHGQPKLHR
jgi:hypothetical protein